MRTSRSSVILPLPVRLALRKLGRDLRDARRRRRIPLAIAAERASISRATLIKIEKGDPGVALGLYATVLFVMDLTDRLADLVDVSVLDAYAYSGQTPTYLLQPKQNVTYANSLQASFGWYDLTIRVNSDPSFQRQLAGHVETGRPSVTDPAIGGSQE